MAIVDILRVKFSFLAERLPKLFISQIKHEKLEEEQNKHNDLSKIIGKVPLTGTEPIRDTDINFYIESSKKYSSRDIDDILQETKHITQKMIALMQSVINTLCGCAGTRTEANLTQLSKFFRSVIKYFVIKMAIHKTYGMNFASEFDDMQRNVTLFLETFMRMDLPSFAQIIENEMAFLCRCIATPVAAEALKELNIANPKIFNNDFLMKIPQYMKEKAMNPEKDKPESMKGHICVFSYLLLKHLLEQFDKIGGYKMQEQSEEDITKYNHYLMLFKYGMETFVRVENNEQINSFYSNFIILCMKYSRKSVLFNNYFIASRIVCRAIKDRSSIAGKEALVKDFPFRELVALLPGALPTLLSLRQEYLPLNELIIEIIQNLLIAFQIMREYLPMLIRPLTECISTLRMTGSLAISSLRLLELWLTRLVESPEFMDVLYEMVPELIPSLHKLFTSQTTMLDVSKMLASLGGKARPYVTEKEASTKF